MTNIKTDYPLVSAIMLAGKCHIEDIKLAIQCFKNQTYPYKELIIVNNAINHFEATSLNITAEHDIFLLDTPTTYYAGMARNYGIASSNGQILAQFDPDYWYAPNRLEVQIANLAEQAADVVMLQSTLEYSFISGMSSYNQNEANAILNTMVFIRPRELDYPNLQKQEEFGLLTKLTNKQAKIITIDAKELACKLYFTDHGRVFKPKNFGLSKNDFSIVNKIIKNTQNSIEV